MTKEKAIQILTGQREKLSDTQFNADVWLSQTKGYVKQFFGDNSEQYKFLNDFSFAVFIRPMNADRSLKGAMLQAKKDSAKQFIDDCIEYLRHNDLYKPPKTNFFHSISETAIWTILGVGVPGLIYIGFFFGNLYSDKQNTDLRNENKLLKDSLVIFKTSFSTIKPDSQTEPVVNKPIDSANH